MFKKNKIKLKIKDKESNYKINKIKIENKNKFLLNISINNSIKLDKTLDSYLNIRKNKKNFNLNNNKNNSIQKEKNLSFNNKNKFSSICTKISNKKCCLKSLNNFKIKNNLRNKKLIDYSTQFKSEYEIKSQSESVTTTTNTKRNKNLTQTNLSISNKKFCKMSLNLIKNKIYNKLNSLRGKSLHLKNKEEENIISEESVFNSKNSSNTLHNKSNNSKLNNSILYIKASNKNILETSLTYSDDTDTKRYEITKNKIMNNNEINKQSNYNDYNDKNNHIKKLNLYKNEDFKNFYELIQQKLFGNYDN